MSSMVTKYGYHEATELVGTGAIEDVFSAPLIEYLHAIIIAGKVVHNYFSLYVSPLLSVCFQKYLLSIGSPHPPILTMKPGVNSTNQSQPGENIYI